MNKKHNIIIALLVLVVVWQGYQLYNKKDVSKKAEVLTSREKEREDHDVDHLVKKLKKKFDRDMDSTKDIYDRFFDDDFFGGTKDPFKEMDKWHKRMMRGFDDEDSGIFGKSWDNWYGGKFGIEDIDITTEDKKDKVVMKFKIPGLKDNTLNVDINDNRIKVECDIKEVKEESDDKGMRYFSSSSHRRFSRMLPVPVGVDAGKAQVETKGETLIISFPKV